MMKTPIIDTVLLIYVPTIWETTNRRYAFLALAETLPRNIAVVCVDRPIDLLVTPLTRPCRFLSGIRRLGDFAVGDRLRVIRPRLLIHEIPAARIPGLTAINRRLLGRQLRQMLRRHFPDVGRILQWIHHPVQRWVYDIFPDAGRIYHCYDEYTCSDDGRFQAALWQKEKLVIEEAAITFITSDSLRHRREKVARRLALIPNGIPEFFFQPRPPLADPIDRIPRPRIGYLGHIFALLDYELLHDISVRHPEWQMVFVGPIFKEALVRRLRGLSNVHFVGTRPHEDLPGILRRFDVGLMPFLVNDFTRPLVPLKLYEYLAAGVPVVSTELPNLHPFQSLIRLVPNEPAAYEAAIAGELIKDRAATAVRLQEAAREFTWSRINQEYVIPVLREVFGV